MYKIGVHGATGRIGKRIYDFLIADEKFSCSYAYSRKSDHNDIDALFNLSDVIIDFSVRDAFDNMLSHAVKASKPLVIGTTGLSAVQKEQMAEAAKSIAILYSPNMTVGATVINSFLKEYGKNFKNYDIDIIETHHRNKKDAPSGTALMFGSSIAEVTNEDFNNYHSIRSGDLGFSDHEIIFSNGPERIKISHQILSSDLFARTSILAAKWILDSKKRSGLYDMSNLL